MKKNKASGILVFCFFTFFLYLSTFLSKQLEESDFSQANIFYGSDSFYFVERVVDGDTIEIKDNFGQKVKVRLVGVDSPEISNGAECYAKEAAGFAEEKLLNELVFLERDFSQGVKDRYGRYLAIVFVGDENFNLELLKGGFAKTVSYAKSHQYYDDFLLAESFAKDLKLGVWSSECL